MYNSQWAEFCTLPCHTKVWFINFNLKARDGGLLLGPRDRVADGFLRVLNIGGALKSNAYSSWLLSSMNNGELLCSSNDDKSSDDATGARGGNSEISLLLQISILNCVFESQISNWWWHYLRRNVLCLRDRSANKLCRTCENRGIVLYEKYIENILIIDPKNRWVRFLKRARMRSSLSVSWRKRRISSGGWI